MTDRAADRCFSAVVLTLTTWVMAIGLAAFCLGKGVSSCAKGLAFTVRGLALR
jgi:hypothetical protein